MEGLPSRMIDIYSHILPPKYKAALFKVAGENAYIKLSSSMPPLFDINLRLRHLEKYAGLMEVITTAAPPLEYVTSPADNVKLARLVNDEMAELVARYPDKIAAAVACLPMNDIDAALKELDYAIKELHCKGIQLYTSINGKPLDSPEFIDIYKKMADYDLPIWIHPARDSSTPDYPGEKKSKYMLYRTFGWPYETSLAMARLVFSGILVKFPNLKIITHHCGAMIPYFAERVAKQQVSDEPEALERLPKPPVEYFHKFYGDTSLSGSTSALMCGYAFFGTGNVLFGSDYPFGRDDGEPRFKSTLESVIAMDIPGKDKERVFYKNAERLLHLPAKA